MIRDLHNQHDAHPGPVRAVGAISCLRADSSSFVPAVQDVTVEVALGRLLVTFDDGSSVDFDLSELLACVGEHEVGRLRAA